MHSHAGAEIGALPAVGVGRSAWIVVGVLFVHLPAAASPGVRSVSGSGSDAEHFAECVALDQSGVANGCFVYPYDCYGCETEIDVSRDRIPESVAACAGIFGWRCAASLWVDVQRNVNHPALLRCVPCAGLDVRLSVGYVVVHSVQHTVESVGDGSVGPLPSDGSAASDHRVYDCGLCGACAGVCKPGCSRSGGYVGSDSDGSCSRSTGDSCGSAGDDADDSGPRTGEIRN